MKVSRMKWIAMLLALVLMIPTLPAYAADTEPAVLVKLEMDPSGSAVKKNDEIKFTAEITDESGVSGEKSFYLMFKKDGSNITEEIYLTKNEEGKYEGTYTVPSSLDDGTYSCIEIYIKDDAENEKHYTDFYSGFYFTITGNSVDEDPPLLKSFILDKEEVKTGEKITITAEIEDKTGITGAQAFYAQFKNVNKNTPTDTIYLTPAGGGVYKAELLAQSYYPLGYYECTEIYARDDAGNGTYYPGDAANVSFKIICTGSHTMTAGGVIKAATCTEGGEMFMICEDCEYSYKVNTTALGHNIVTDAAIEPTCTTVGHTAKKYCNREDCDFVADAGTEIPAKKHEFVDGYCKNCTLYAPVPKVLYKTHMQGTGWTNEVTNGVTSGLPGAGKRMEAFQIKLDRTGDVTGGITYRAHVQTIGWQSWVSDDAMAGTEGLSKRAEAMQIKLTGEMEENFDVYYRAYVESFGWLGWAKNGQSCGSSGYGNRMEAIQIVIVRKGEAGPGETKNAYRCKEGHTHEYLQESLVKGTCTEAEYRLMRCYCGEERKEYTGSSTAPGHKGSDRLYKAPTCTTAGYEKVVCEVCGKTVNETLKALGHDYVGTVTTPATTTTDGLMTYQCSRCTEKYTEKIAAYSEVVRYRAQIMELGLQDWKKNGAMAGTIGVDKGIESVYAEIRDKDNKQVKGIAYRCHVQGIGWQSWVSNGVMAGTAGQNKRVEAIQIQLTGDMVDRYDVYYRTYCQKKGWLGWAKNGQSAGTSGFGYRMEAYEIRLVVKGGSAPGSTANAFVSSEGHTHEYVFDHHVAGTCTEVEHDVRSCYCGATTKRYATEGSAPGHQSGSTSTHVDPTCTTDGYDEYECQVCHDTIKTTIKKLGHDLHSADIKPATEAAEGVRQYSCSRCPYSYTEPIPKLVYSIRYRTHVQTYGDQAWKSNGEMSGTSGESKRLEAIWIELKDPAGGAAIGVSYQTHVQGKGWLAWSKDGAMNGTSGESKRLEAIRIELTPAMAAKYDIYYCVHAQTYGWLNWAKNGDPAGTEGLSKRLEGIKIVLVPKGGEAPKNEGTNSKAFIK